MMDLQNLFYHVYTMCPNFKHNVCAANSEYCQPENCAILYWVMKMVEDYHHNGVIQRVIKGK